MSTQPTAPAIDLVVEPETKEDLKRAVAAACLMQLASLTGEGHMNQAQEFAIATIGNELDVRFPALHENQVMMFVRLLESGVTVPPIGIYTRDGQRFVYDGRHRLEAHRRLGWEFVMGIEIAYTTKADMLCHALRSNVSPDGTPLSPSLQDFNLTIRSLVKEGVTKDDIIQRLTTMGIHESFVRRLVTSAINSKAQLDKYHAVDDVKAGRRTVLEAAERHSVSAADVEKRLATPAGYGLDRFIPDVKKRFKGIRELASLRLPELVNGSVEFVGGAPLAVGRDAIALLKKEAESLLNWVIAQEVSLNGNGDHHDNS
jgi:hypothetical protein